MIVKDLHHLDFGTLQSFRRIYEDFVELFGGVEKSRSFVLDAIYFGKGTFSDFIQDLVV